VFYGSNPFRKDNPQRAISNAAETPKVPEAAFQVLLPPLGGAWECPAGNPGRGTGALDRIRNGGGIGAAWMIGLPRRAGARLHALNDAEARWWHWHVSEYRGGLVRQYRDARFAELPVNPGLRRNGLGAGLDPAPARPDAACPGDR
jgi:hypothetical protein